MKKIAPVILIAFLIWAVIALTPQAKAGVVGSLLGNCVENSATCAIYAITYVVTTILSLFVTFGAWLVKLALGLNQGVESAATVQTGFSISLAIANLGFVLAIIVIAIATILRSQTYGLKKILLKLIFAAILVNFSLVIAGAVLNFANSLTYWFLSNVSPAIGGDVYGLNSGFIDSMVSSFSPQDLFQPPDTVDLEQALGTFVQAILNMVFGIVFLVLIFIILAAFAAMLLIRYVYLVVLLILMPFVWLCWIFPRLQSNWEKWWHNFVRWAFFAPLGIFFLYLAVTTAPALNPSTIEPYSPSGTAVATIRYLTKNGDIIGSLGQRIAVLALAFGALFAANALSITGAKEAISITKGAGALAAGWAGRRGRQLGTAPLRSEGGRRLATGLQQSRSPVARWLGRGLETLSVGGGERQVASYGKEVGNLTPDQALNQLSTSNAMRRWAILDRAKKEGWADDPEKQKRLQDYLGRDKEAEAKRYGQGQLFKELRVATGLDLEDKLRDYEGAPADQKDDKRRELDGAIAKLATDNPELLAKKFMGDEALRKLEDSLAQKGLTLPVTLRPENMIAMRQAITKALPSFSPTGASEFLSALSKGNNLGQFRQAVEGLKENAEEFRTVRRKFVNNIDLRRYASRLGGRRLIDLAGLYDLREELVNRRQTNQYPTPDAEDHPSS